jgi:hypothetical protein
MSRKEEGFILPIALAICTLVSFICFMWLSQSIRAQQVTRLYGEQVRVQYALESGMAQMQAHLQQGQSAPIVHRIGSVRVQVRLQERAPRVVLQVTAQGRWGVKKSAQIELDEQGWQEVQQMSK